MDEHSDFCVVSVAFDEQADLDEHSDFCVVSVAFEQALSQLFSAFFEVRSF